MDNVESFLWGAMCGVVVMAALASVILVPAVWARDRAIANLQSYTGKLARILALLDQTHPEINKDGRASLGDVAREADQWVNASVECLSYPPGKCPCHQEETK